MSDRIRWIDYKGVRILLCDFSKFNEAEYITGTEEMEKELLKQPRGSTILHIVDVTDSTMSKATSDRGKETIRVLTEAGVKTMTTMVGITGIKKVIAQAISRDVYFAGDMDAAKEYLYTQSTKAKA